MDLRVLGELLGPLEPKGNKVLLETVVETDKMETLELEEAMVSLEKMGLLDCLELQDLLVLLVILVSVVHQVRLDLWEDQERRDRLEGKETLGTGARKERRERGERRVHRDSKELPEKEETRVSLERQGGQGTEGKQAPPDPMGTLECKAHLDHRVAVVTLVRQEKLGCQVSMDHLVPSAHQEMMGVMVRKDILDQEDLQDLLVPLVSAMAALSPPIPTSTRARHTVQKLYMDPWRIQLSLVGTCP